jgi:hypothetical protein
MRPPARLIQKCYLCSPGCSPWPAAAWSPVRLGLVRCAPASLYSSYCAARRRPGCLVASTRSGSRRRRHSLLADDVEPGPPPVRLVSQSAAQRPQRPCRVGLGQARPLQTPVPVRSGHARTGQSVDVLDLRLVGRSV